MRLRSVAVVVCTVSFVTAGAWLANGIAGASVPAASTAASVPAKADAGVEATRSSQDSAATWTVDGVHSSIVFKVKHLDTAYVWGRFNEMSGSFVLDPENPDNSRVDVTVPAASIDTNNENRDQHLRSPDFFNAREFENLRFASESFRRTGDKTFEASGEMTMLGVTKPLTVAIRHTGDSESQRFGTRRGFEATFTVKRSDFGMTYMPDGLSDEIAVTVSIEGVASE